jgi:hypothetical protein
MVIQNGLSQKKKQEEMLTRDLSDKPGLWHQGGGSASDYGKPR